MLLAKYNEALTSMETYKERYVRPLPNKGNIYIGSPWETGKTYTLENLDIPDNVNLLVLSTKDVQGIVHALKANFSELRIKEYYEGVFQWLLNAKRECLSRELQNRGIFSDIDSIIQNKDVPSVRLWVAYMLEKYCSQHLFDWRMVDFLRKAGMEVLIIKTAPKSKENTLLQVVKVKCFMVKAEEISEIS
ncbi:hypothetical protein GLOIN_2v1765104 [Rhizophagus clarus]|uniref:Replication origin-binding protein domain-containing protein n=1 Tax=Rhizophagus clarus TaxID=94130 RepID=A0A8H3LPR2_9GLOM|nr:hypothetical protein GLOIN_2v1765104 [Rhizophagus clarus]